MATTREKAQHDKRRRIWDRAFSARALESYEERLVYYAQVLENKIASLSGEPINITPWFYFYGFDVMGNLAFRESFDMMKEGKSHFAVDLIRGGMALLGPFSSVPWLVKIGLNLPGIAQSWKKMLQWSEEQLQQRLKSDVDKPDIMSWLINASKENNTMLEDKNWLQGDSFAIIIAGSDTVASSLVFLFSHLARDLAQLTKLRIELQTLNSVFDFKALQSLDHLNGVINETLRLHPPVPSGPLRVTPPDGVTIAGHYVPGDTVVAIPSYSLGRLENCFKQAGEFIPERWYSKPDMILDKTAFAPFSSGRYGCIGKNLALMQIRSVVALLVSKYDICLSPNDDGVDVLSNMKDQFTAYPGRLELVFRLRDEEPQRTVDSDME
ncbi:hypothetical protein MMC14_005963 [Varicellaria rhodocarpa]|nr:hypothetical protein [Varicellaria rhodocarpa]